MSGVLPADVLDIVDFRREYLSGIAMNPATWLQLSIIFYIYIFMYICIYIYILVVEKKILMLNQSPKPISWLSLSI